MSLLEETLAEREGITIVIPPTEDEDGVEVELAKGCVELVHNQGDYYCGSYSTAEDYVRIDMSHADGKEFLYAIKIIDSQLTRVAKKIFAQALSLVGDKLIEQAWLNAGEATRQTYRKQAREIREILK